MGDRNQPKHAVNILTAPEQMLQAIDKYYFFLLLSTVFIHPWLN